MGDAWWTLISPNEDPVMARIMLSIFDAQDIRVIIEGEIEASAHRTRRAWASAHSINAPSLTNVLRGRELPWAGMLSAIGMRPVKVYIPIDHPMFAGTKDTLRPDRRLYWERLRTAQKAPDKEGDHG